MSFLQPWVIPLCILYLHFHELVISIKLIKSIWFFFYFLFREIYQFYFNLIIANNFQTEHTSKCTYLYGRTNYSTVVSYLAAQIIVLPVQRLFNALICICVCNIYSIDKDTYQCTMYISRIPGCILSHHAPFI